MPVTVVISLAGISQILYVMTEELFRYLICHSLLHSLSLTFVSVNKAIMRHYFVDSIIKHADITSCRIRQRQRLYEQCSVLKPRLHVHAGYLWAFGSIVLRAALCGVCERWKITLTWKRYCSSQKFPGHASITIYGILTWNFWLPLYVCAKLFFFSFLLFLK